MTESSDDSMGSTPAKRQRTWSPASTSRGSCEDTRSTSDETQWFSPVDDVSPVVLPSAHLLHTVQNGDTSDYNSVPPAALAPESTVTTCEPSSPSHLPRANVLGVRAKDGHDDAHTVLVHSLCRSTASSVPLRHFSVDMPNLDAQPVDFDVLPPTIVPALTFLRCLSPRDLVPDEYVANLRPLLPPQEKGCMGRRTVVFDLDETLVHCHPCRLVNGREPDLRMKIDSVDPPFDAYVYVRPFVKMLLQEVATFAEIVIFTASAAVYADKVIDFLDPCGSLVASKLYRTHCIEIAGGYFKDMRMLGRRQEDIVLVDNSPVALGLTPENGILCSSWFGDDYEDDELRRLLPVLRQCCAELSIPAFLTSRYGLPSFFARQRASRITAMSRGHAVQFPQFVAPTPSPTVSFDRSAHGVAE